MSAEIQQRPPEIPSGTKLSELTLAYTYVILRNAGHAIRIEPSKQEAVNANNISQTIPHETLVEALSVRIKPSAGFDELYSSIQIFRGLIDILKKTPPSNPAAIFDDNLTVADLSMNLGVALYRNGIEHSYDDSSRGSY